MVGRKRAAGRAASSSRGRRGRPRKSAGTVAVRADVADSSDSDYVAPDRSDSGSVDAASTDGDTCEDSDHEYRKHRPRRRATGTARGGQRPRRGGAGRSDSGGLAAGASLACGQCDRETFASLAALQRHIDSAHNGLARRAGDDQHFSARQSRAAFGRVLKSGLSLVCRRCTKTFRSVTGFTGHQSVCGANTRSVRAYHDKRAAPSAAAGPMDTYLSCRNVQLLMQTDRLMPCEHQLQQHRQLVDAMADAWRLEQLLEVGRMTTSAVTTTGSSCICRCQILDSEQKQLLLQQHAPSLSASPPYSISCTSLDPRNHSRTVTVPVSSDHQPPLPFLEAVRHKAGGGGKGGGDRAGADGRASLLMFCGDPVLSLDWRQARDALYLAVACRPATSPASAALSPLSCTRLPAAVQVWRVRRQLDTSPRLLYRLCLQADCGPLWQVQWAPGSSGDGDSRGGGGGRGGGGLRWAGVLAAACGDGVVRLLLLPSESHIQQQHTSSFTCCGRSLHLRAAAALTLCLPEGGQSPCLQVQWSRASQRCLLTAGFGDGSLAVWHVNTTSALLRTCGDGAGGDGGGGPRVYPIQVVAAHCGHVSALCGSARGDRFVFSGGRDRQLYVWDREEPVHMARAASKNRPQPTSACWPLPGPAGTHKLAIGFDHSLHAGTSSAAVLHTVVPQSDTGLCTVMASCSAVAVHAPASLVAMATESGLVALVQWRSVLTGKHKDGCRQWLMRVCVERVMEQQQEEQEEAASGAAARGGEEEHVQMVRFSDVDSRHATSTGLLLDSQLQQNGSWVTRRPLAAVRALAWHEPHSVLAVALECGFVRIVYVPPDIADKH